MSTLGLELADHRSGRVQADRVAPGLDRLHGFLATQQSHAAAGQDPEVPGLIAVLDHEDAPFMDEDDPDS